MILRGPKDEEFGSDATRGEAHQGCYKTVLLLFSFYKPLLQFAYSLRSVNKVSV